jgi:uncharacterized repeat protein (TIGR01451 family)
MISHTPVTSLFAIATRGDIAETSRPSDNVPAFVSGEYRVDLAAESFAPASAVTGDEIEIDTIVTNNGPAAIYGFHVEIPRTPGTSYVSASTTSGSCWLGGLQLCGIDLLGSGDSATIRERVRVTAASGKLQHFATALLWNSPYNLLIDPNPSNNTASAVIQVVAPPVVAPPRHRPARH